MQRKSLALRRWNHGVVLAAMVHGQGLQGEVATVPAQAWCCRIPAHMELCAVPKKPLRRKQLAFGRAGGGRPWGPTQSLLEDANCISGGRALRSGSHSRGGLEGASEDGPGSCVSLLAPKNPKFKKGCLFFDMS